jgi:hypothetical protein
MDKVLKPSDYECYIPQLELFKIQEYLPYGDLHETARGGN